MAGLARVLKAYGLMTVIGNDGRKVEWAWDYAADEPVDSAEMPIGSERWKASERAKYAPLSQAIGNKERK